MPVPVPPRWGKPLIAFERITMSLADLAKGGNVALALYRDADMDRGLFVSGGKRVFEGPFEKAAARYNATMRKWWEASNGGAPVPADKLYKAVSISPDDADQIRRLLDKPHATDVDEARITRFARKYGIRQEGGSSYNRKILAALLEQNGESSSKAARPAMRKAGGGEWQDTKHITLTGGGDAGDLSLTLQSDATGKNGRVLLYDRVDFEGDYAAAAKKFNLWLKDYNRRRKTKVFAGDLASETSPVSKAARPVMRKAKSPADALLSPSAWKKSGKGENATVKVGEQTFHCTISQSGGWTGDDWIAEVLPVGNVSSKKSPDAMGSREQAVQWCIDFIKGRTRKAAGAAMRKARSIIEDGEGAPNLDSASVDELKGFVAEIGVGTEIGTKAASRMFPGQGTRGVGAAKSLRSYAENKIKAMTARQSGDIKEAQKYETICDRIFAALPSWATW